MVGSNNEEEVEEGAPHLFQTTTSPSIAGRFGTFAGVFTPNVLTILGLILFLRIGFVTAHAGLWHTLLIVALANGISFLTGLSLSAIATSMEVRAGGNYYIISRSLGLEIGGAIGIPLYLSQAISVAFYIIGFTESARSLPFFQAFDPRIISATVAILFIMIAWVGADFALKIQFGIFAVLAASIVSFFAGGWQTISEPVLTPQYTSDVNFWVAFAIFFPAVTGITVGTSMSGDLKDPTTAIPRGTIWSIIITAIIYTGVVIWFSFHMPDRQFAIENSMAIQEIALFPQLILAGVWASTLSSALGSILAAPRTLQAIAYDTVVPRRLGSNLGHPTEPRMAIIITAIITLIVILMGDLNAVAPIISMFFLNTYGITNLAAGIEKLVGNPSYRPRFNIPWYLSLLGAFGCYSTMFLINRNATIISIVITGGIYFYLQRKELSRTWGDVRSGIWIALARFALIRLEGFPETTKNWRPNLMVFTGQPHNRRPLVEVAAWLSHGKGIVTFFQLIVGKIEKQANKGMREDATKRIAQYIRDNNMEAFAEAEIVEDFHIGILTIAQAHGVGGISSNTLLLGWSGTVEGRIEQMALTRQLHALKKSVIFLAHDPMVGFGERKTIQIWWQGGGGNGDLMVLLGHIIRQHRSWDRATINVMMIVESEAAVAETRDQLKAFLKQVRVNGIPVVLVNPGAGLSTFEIIKRESRDADLTILGMHTPEASEEAYYENLHTLIPDVGTTLLVRNGIEGEDLLFN